MQPHYIYILSVDPLNKKALLRMSTKTLNFLRSLDVGLPFFIFVFKFFYEIYKGFLVYLIAKLNLAINEQSEKFWHEINDKAIWEGIGEYRDFGKVIGGGLIGKFLVVLGVGSSMG